MKKAKYINKLVRFEDKTLQQLTAEAKKTPMPVTSLINIAVKKYLAESQAKAVN